ncbi:MAG TPA: hypothetical protein PLT23_12610, partial [Lentisphaeria bacterium]|nr:hypothetical protein [Lentisphaeria bacterium]
KAFEDAQQLIQAALGNGTFDAEKAVANLRELDEDERLGPSTGSIVEAAVACQVPLEINAYGLRKKMVVDSDGCRHLYPLRRFWEIAAEYDDLQVVVNSDAHLPEDVWGNTDDAIRLAQELRLRVVNDSLDEDIRIRNAYHR